MVCQEVFRPHGTRFHSSLISLSEEEMKFVSWLSMKDEIRPGLGDTPGYERLEDTQDQ